MSSGESIKFFEEKSLEEIINWMIGNLEEKDIRTCLEQAGVPQLYPAEVAAAAAGASLSTIQAASVAAAASAAAGMSPEEVEASAYAEAVADAAETKEISDALDAEAVADAATAAEILPAAAAAASGAGGSGVMVPPSMAETQAMQTMLTPTTASERLLIKYRNKCREKGYIIEKIGSPPQYIVHYWEFGILTDEDIEEVPQKGTVGERRWVKRVLPIAEFKDEDCKDDKTSEFDEDKIEYLAQIAELDDDIKNTISNYWTLGGLLPPFNLPIPDISPPVYTPSQEVLKGINAQLGLMDYVKSHPELANLGISIPPLFIYDATSTAVKHYTIQVKDGRLVLEDGATKMRIIKSGFTQKTDMLSKAIREGKYVPTAESLNELQVQVNLLDAGTREKIRVNYTPESIGGLTFFGSKKRPHESNMNKMGRLSDLSVAEIEKYGKVKFGEPFVQRCKPNIIVNKFGVKTVQWVSRA